MAQRRNGNGSSNGKSKTNGKANGKVKVAVKPRANYKAMYEEAQRQLEALRNEIDDVNLMLDAVECPPNCGTLNGRMVEFARKNYKKYGSMTNPGGEARKMLQAVQAPVGADGPPWSMYGTREQAREV